MKRLVLLACLGWVGAVSAEPVNVRAVPLAEVLEVPVYSAPATVAARNQPQVAAEIDARVIALPVLAGDHVSAGDTLARLDCRSHESRLALARAELEITHSQQRFAREQLRRAENLKKNKNISEETLDQRRAELEAKQAEATARGEGVRQAAIDVGHCRIKAPFDATVTQRLVSVGTFVARGQAVVGLLETTGQEVSVPLRADEIAELQQAKQPVFESAGNVFPVRLRSLLPALDPVARTREARLVFSAEAPLPGSVGRLTWRGSQPLIPPDYLVRRDDQLGIFVLRDQRAHFIALPGAQEGRPAAIDLAPDTQLITDGRQSLADVDEVNIVPAREQP